MKKQHSWLSLTIFVMMLFVLSPHAYADNMGQFNQMIQGIRDHRAQVEAQLGIDPQLDTYPQPTCYYDDLEDHYEHAQLMRDVIAQGLP